MGLLHRTPGPSPGDFLTAAMSCRRKLYLGPSVCCSMFELNWGLRILRSHAEGESFLLPLESTGAALIPAGLSQALGLGFLHLALSSQMQYLHELPTTLQWILRPLKRSVTCHR